MFHIEVGKGDLRFSAAHFISFLGKCERLHGHNYGVSVAVDGSLTSEGLVFDFVQLKKIVREICESLDHRFLLPMESTCFQIQDLGEEWTIRFGDKRYVFPASDVFVLPVDNITAERLAEYICRRIVEKLDTGTGNIAAVTVGVEEAPGQAAHYRHSFTSEAAPRTA